MDRNWKNPFLPFRRPLRSPSLTPEEARELQKQQSEERMKAMQAQSQRRMRNALHKGMFTLSWGGLTTTEFAERLSSRAGGPVVDETGVIGKYLFRVETWPAIDDDPGQTIFEAVEKLGLKLVPRNVPLDLLVIDKVSKAPVAN